jgi:predicted PurR-regulated permease PerM
MPQSSGTQRAVRIGLAMGLFLLGLWTVRDFVPALGWAVVFAIGTWPVYTRFARQGKGAARQAPFLFTLLVTLLFVVPLVVVAVVAAREASVVVQSMIEAQRTGLAVPDWLTRLPYVGDRAATWWRENLSDPDAAAQLLGRVDRRTVLHWTGVFGAQLFRRLALLAIMLLTLFFLFRDGAGLGRRVLALADRTIGPQGRRLANHMIAAVHGTVNGLVLVGLGEGLILAIVYVATGVPHPVLFGAATGVLAIIPFGAPVVFGVASLLLLAQGNTIAAAVVLGIGLAVVFVADHFVRPVLIGGAVRLPFLWVLLGILGGVETFGLLGLFLGPAIMAALFSLWQDWTDSALLADDCVPPRNAAAPAGPPVTT